MGTTNKLRSIIDYTGAILDDKIDAGGIVDDTRTLAHTLVVILTFEVLLELKDWSYY